MCLNVPTRPDISSTAVCPEVESPAAGRHPLRKPENNVLPNNPRATVKTEMATCNELFSLGAGRATSKAFAITSQSKRKEHMKGKSKCHAPSKSIRLCQTPPMTVSPCDSRLVMRIRDQNTDFKSIVSRALFHNKTVVSGYPCRTPHSLSSRSFVNFHCLVYPGPLQNAVSVSPYASYNLCVGVTHADLNSVSLIFPCSFPYAVVPSSSS